MDSRAGVRDSMMVAGPTKFYQTPQDSVTLLMCDWMESRFF